MADTQSTTELSILGPVIDGGLVIGSFWDLTNFPELLAENKDKDIEILIDSLGGSVFGGFNISNLIARRDKKTTVTVIGMAASIASIIAMSADVLQMSSNSILMIHQSSGFEWGNSDQMRKTAEILEKIDKNMVSIYVDKIDRTGKLIDGDREKTERKIMSMIKAETWLTAKEAFELGLIDKIVEGREDVTPNAKTDNISGFSASLQNFKNVPTQILSKYQNNMNDKKTIWAAIKSFFVSEIKAEAKAIEAAEATQDEQMTQNEMIEALKKEGYNIEKAEAKEEVKAQQPETKETVKADPMAEMQAKFEAMQKEQETLKAELKAAKFKAAAKSSDAQGEGEKGNSKPKISASNKSAFDALATLLQSK